MNLWLFEVTRSILGAVVAFVAGLLINRWWQRRQRRKMQELIRELQVDRQGGQAALVLSIGEHAIETAVRMHLRQAGIEIGLWEVLHRPELLPQDSDAWMAYLEEIKKRVRELKTAGVTQIHLFLSIPIGAAVILGAILDNGPEAVIYQYFNGVYKPVGHINAIVTKG